MFNRKWIFVIVLVFLVLLFLFKGEFILYKVLKGTGRFFYQSTLSLEEENELKQQIKKLEFENTKSKLLEQENEILRKYLDFKKKKEFELVLVNVLNKKEELGFEIFLLDQGEKQGIKEGMAVVDKNGFLIGKIIRVEKDFSSFLPLSDSRFKISAAIIGEEDLISGIIRGFKEQSLLMDYLPAQARFKIGDKVISLGLEENTVTGLPIGEVVSFEDNPQELFKKATVKPFSKKENPIIVGIIKSQY